MDRAGFGAVLAAALLFVGAGPASAAPRPAPPAGGRPAEPSEADCLNRSEAEFAPQAEVLMKYFKDREDYSQRLMSWEIDQLLAKGVWTKSSVPGHMVEILRDPRFTAREAAKAPLLADLLEQLQAVLNASERKDKAGTCKALLRMTKVVDEISANNDAQWRLTEEIFAAEARKKGVSLD